MGMNGFAQVFTDRGHLHRQDAFSNQLASTGTGNGDAEDTIRLRIDDQLGHAVVTAQSQGSAVAAPGKLGSFDLDLAFSSLGLGQSAPGDFGIGKDHCGDRAGIEHCCPAGSRFGGNIGFTIGLVCQHRLADDIAEPPKTAWPNVEIDERMQGSNLQAVLEGLRTDMRKAAENLEFERAASIRDTIRELTAQLAAPAPAETKSLPVLMSRPGVAERIREKGVRYIVWLDGDTERVAEGGSLSCAAGPGGGGCFGFAWWQNDASGLAPMGAVWWLALLILAAGWSFANWSMIVCTLMLDRLAPTFPSTAASRRAR